MKQLRFPDIFRVIVIISLLSGISLAQEERRGPGIPDSAEIAKRVNKLAESLELTPAQRDTILQLQIAHFAKAKTLFEDEGIDRRERMETMREMRKELEQQIMPILTEEQQEKYKEIMKETEKRRRPPRD